MAVTRRGHEVMLTVSFLAVIFAVPLTQAVIELREGETLQCLDLLRETPSRDNLRIYEDALESQSWFAQTFRPWVQYARYRALRDAGVKAIVGRDGWWFYRPGVRYLIEPAETQDAWDGGRRQAVRAIVRFRDQLASRGIRLLVVPVPGKASAYPEKLSTRAAKAGPSVHAHTQTVIDDLSKAGVEVVDLFDAFARARTAPGSKTGEPKAYFLTRDTHWTGTGVRLAAQVVAARARQLGWAETGSVRYGRRWVSVRRQGDILRMLKTPPIERRFAPETVACPQVVRRDTGEPYRDDPNARILVLGDSFLRIYERDEPGSAGFIANLACELGQPLVSIVNDGGASTLVRQELARRPELLAGKTLVIWEFVERDIRFGMEGWQDVPLPDEVPMSRPAPRSQPSRIDRDTTDAARPSAPPTRTPDTRPVSMHPCRTKIRITATIGTGTQ